MQPLIGLEEMLVTTAKVAHMLALSLKAVKPLLCTFRRREWAGAVAKIFQQVLHERGERERRRRLQIECSAREWRRNIVRVVPRSMAAEWERCEMERTI